MDEQVKTSFEFAQTATKEMIALATAVITVTVTFSKDFLGKEPGEATAYALGSWIFFLASIFFGLWTLLALTGSLAPLEKGSPTIRGLNIRIPSFFQIASFFGGLVLTVIFGFKVS